MDITLHDCWNKTIKKTELILAVAAFNQSYDINWYKISDDLKMVSCIKKRRYFVIFITCTGKALDLVDLQKNSSNRIF